MAAVEIRPNPKVYFLLSATLDVLCSCRRKNKIGGQPADQETFIFIASRRPNTIHQHLSDSNDGLLSLTEDTFERILFATMATMEV